MVIWSVTSNYASEVDYEKRYLLADKVSMRACPAADCEVLASLPIGAGLTLYDVSSNTFVIDGIESAWYKTQYAGKEGWIWGGLLARYSFGSNADPSVKFLAGPSGLVWDEEWGSHRRTYQIRAVQNGEEVDKLVLKTFGWSFGPLKNLGSQGLNVDDILMLDVPCEGGCGCTAGTIVVFWDGSRLHHVKDLMGSADADYSSSVQFIFPSEMEGREGMIIQRVSDYEDSDEMYERKVILRYVEDSFWKWNGEELVDTGLPVERSEFELKVEY